MYSEEMDQWLAEARLEETRSEARLRAALIRDLDTTGSSIEGPLDDSVPEVGVRQRARSIHDDPAPINGEIVQVVEDEDEVTTIRRPVLPDILA